MIVYWCPFLMDDSYFLNVKEPEPLIKHLKNRTEGMTDKQNFLKCPSVNNYIKNTFIAKSPVNLDITFKNGQIFTSQYDQEFLDKNIMIRHAEDLNYFLTIHIAKLLFFSEEDLEMEFAGAYFSESKFSTSTMVIPGTVSISKWLRPTDLAFIVNKDVTTLPIKEHDHLYYVRFKTNEPVKLKKFFMTEKLIQIVKRVIHQKNYMADKSVSTYFNRAYDYFEQSKVKKIILKEIKNNLME